jgi:hypothetical protein
MRKDRSTSEEALETLYRYYMQEAVDINDVKQAVEYFKHWSRIRNTKTAKTYNASINDPENHALDTAIEELFDVILNYSTTIKVPTYIPRKTVKGGKRKSRRFTRRA